MRKIPYRIPALAALVVCVVAGCNPGSTSSSSAPITANPPTAPATSTAPPVTKGSPTARASSPPPVTSSTRAVARTPPGQGGGTRPPGQGGGTSPAAGLLRYVPSGLRANCFDTGTSGHLAPSVSGYTDSVTCNLGGSTPAEVDYYQYASAGDMRSAYDSASVSDAFDSPQQPGGCAGESDEYGTWSSGGATTGDIACPIDNNNGVNLIWDDPGTDIIAVANAAYWTPAVLYSWWQSNGASIDGTAAGATSS